LLFSRAGAIAVSRLLTSAAVLAALLAAASQAGHANQVVEIHLRGHFFAEPATVQITVAVEPDAHNRLLRIEADSGDFFRASELTLEGDEDKRLHSVEFKNLPAGSYVLKAEVLSTDALLGLATQELVVTGVGGR
jgi:hypothetical protein